MRLKRLLSSLTSVLGWVLFFAVLVGCATVPDVPICVEINMTKGFCTNTVTDKDYNIDEKHPIVLEEGKPARTWWEMRPYMVLVPVTSWKELKAYIIKQCKRTNCDEYIKSWDRKINELEQGASQ